MMNRFEQTKPPIHKYIAFWLPTAAFLVLFLLFLKGIGSVSGATLDKQQESLETALQRSIVQCYAVEGIYPPSLDYIIEHYGLTYDTSVFLVDYEAMGENLTPEVTVLRRKKQSP